MLKQVLSISGKPGLYKLISYGKNMIIVEELTDKKRFPAYAHDKIISLGDIAVYTSGDEVPLTEVMETISKKYDGKALNAAEYKTKEQLQKFFVEILPEYDTERVYNTDIKKIISWYNTLVNAGITEFAEPKAEEAEAPAEEAPKAEEK